MSTKYVYMFSEGNADMKALLGGKGANLAEMTRLSLPVPPGFTVSTEACTRYYEDDEKIAVDIEEQVYKAMAELEAITEKRFGDAENPLLVSVRSGARASMPGMMDTILNLGMSDQAAAGLAKRTENERFAMDSYRRFIQMFSDVVMGIEKKEFEAVLDKAKEEKGVATDPELEAEDLKKVIEGYKVIYKQHIGEDFPQDAKTQLMAAVGAVFRSWNNERAIKYRMLNDIPSSWGTAVNVQSMVFGNMGDTSGTGVAFTRDPAYGDKQLYGEYLINAQGEDVVAGIRTPEPIDTLKNAMPEIYEQFVSIAKTLESHYRDMQDMEFTIENGKLYMLQTRNGKRTATAALQIAIDLYNEGLLNKQEALLKVEPAQLDALLHPTFTSAALKAAVPMAQGIAASPGAASGHIYFTADDAKAAADKGIKVVLVRSETSPEDIEGMHCSEGILTGRGGKTSHAAVIARGMGACCVAGCSALAIDEEGRKFTLPDGSVFNEGDVISIDGNTGNVYAGDLEKQMPELTGNFATIMEWADEFRTLKVRTNADTPEDAAQAVSYGAEGIGLCRTEHMFFGENRISAMREMILSKTQEQRKKALAKLLPMQKQDFFGIYKEMGDRPVTIRFLDPPLHEFLPKEEQEIAKLAAEMDMTVEEMNNAIYNLHEVNPMMGHRGCRLAVSYPEIYEMQATAVIEAALQARKELGINVKPEIMIPLVCEYKELKNVAAVVKKAVADTLEKAGEEMEYMVGTMIEIPRAAITADEIAKEAEFFSFGTNDLTQMTFGFSRDDAGRFLDYYYKKGVFEADPFERLDRNGVGKLVKLAAKMGRETRPDIKLGICGEHGGDPGSVEFCHNAGLNYVSCSPFRVPIARLAAARAAISDQNG